MFIFSGRPACNDSTGNQLLEFFQHNHVEAPEYNTSYKEIHAYPRGSMFLSICVHEFDEETTEEMRERTEDMKRKAFRQLYRIDVPLKIRKDLKSERISLQYLTNLGMPPIDPVVFEKIQEN